MRSTVVVSLALAAAALAAPAANAADSAEATAQAMSDRCAYADASPGQASIGDLRSGTLCLLNAERVARGLRPLRSQGRLARAAGAFADQMAALKFFDHTSPTGSTIVSRVRASGYMRRAASWTIGENIGWGSGSLATPRAAVRGWMNSPPHRENLLNAQFTEIGVGITPGAPEALGDGEVAGIYVTDFGRRRQR
jgi:uncharacterized protein YkwD